MNDIEARLIKLEEGMARMEKAIERMAEAVETLIEIRIHNANNAKEVDKLRDASHQHANALQELPHLRDRVNKVEVKVDKVEGRVDKLERGERTHGFTDNIVGKMLWAGFGFAVWIVLHKVGLV